MHKHIARVAFLILAIGLAGPVTGQPASANDQIESAVSAVGFDGRTGPIMERY